MGDSGIVFLYFFEWGIFAGSGVLGLDVGKGGVERILQLGRRGSGMMIVVVVVVWCK